MTRLRLLLLCGVLALGGCATSSTTPSLFRLDDGQATQSHAPTATSAPVLVIEPVTVAPYLDASGIVYQTAPHRVVVANNNRWASPLTAQLTDALQGALQDTLSGFNVQRVGRGQHPDALRLAVRIDEFLGHYDGTAHIAGQWQLHDATGNTLAGQSFQRFIPLDEDGYPALVTSLSRGWRDQAKAMAGTITARIRPARRGIGHAPIRGRLDEFNGQQGKTNLNAR